MEKISNMVAIRDPLQLWCMVCIGETKRRLETGIEEHSDACTKHFPNSSAILEHTWARPGRIIPLTGTRQECWTTQPELLNWFLRRCCASRKQVTQLHAWDDTCMSHVTSWSPEQCVWHLWHDVLLYFFPFLSFLLPIQNLILPALSIYV